MTQTHATTFAESCNSLNKVHVDMADIHNNLYCRKNPLKFRKKEKRISPSLLQDLKKEYY